MDIAISSRSRLMKIYSRLGIIVITLIEIWLFTYIFSDKVPFLELSTSVKPILTVFFGFSITISIYLIYLAFTPRYKKPHYTDIVADIKHRYYISTKEIENEIENLKKKLKEIQGDDEDSINHGLYPIVAKNLARLEEIKIENNRRKLEEIERVLRQKNTTANNA